MSNREQAKNKTKLARFDDVGIRFDAPSAFRRCSQPANILPANLDDRVTDVHNAESEMVDPPEGGRGLTQHCHCCGIWRPLWMTP